MLACMGGCDLHAIGSVFFVLHGPLRAGHHVYCTSGWEPADIYSSLHHTYSSH